MKWTIAVLITVGVIAAMCAAVLIAGLRTTGTATTPAQADQVEMLVAARPMPAMTVVDGGSVAARLVPAHTVVEPLLDITAIAGKVLIRPVVEGEAFTADHFASENSINLATALPEGKRAMSTLLTTDSGIEALLYPGCVVDVVASFRLPAMNGRSGEVVSATMLQGVQVLAIGPRTIVSAEADSDGGFESNVDRKRKRMVTLMVDSAQAETLQLASAYGELTVTLRNPLDETTSGGGGVLLSDISQEMAKRLARMNPGMNRPMHVASLDDEGSVTPPPPTAPPTATARDNHTSGFATGARDHVYWTTTVLRQGKPETVTFPLEAYDVP